LDSPRWIADLTTPDGVLHHWFLILAFAVAGMALWIRQFSLRTLLIATSLIAAVLTISAQWRRGFASPLATKTAVSSNLA
jgi:hypothetical protein